MDATTAQFRKTALELKAADVALLRLARRNIRVATAPAGEAVKRSALSSLPKGGGANRVIAAKRVSTSILTGPRTAGVKVRMKGEARVNAGVLMHPTFGNRQAWSATTVEPGFFTKPLAEMAPEVTAACVAAMAETARVAGFR